MKAKIFLLLFFFSVTHFISFKSVSNVDTTKWFPFSVNEEFSSSIIDMSDWLDKPAGKHGWLKTSGDDYRFEDGVFVKFWGTNICNKGAFPSKEIADKWADYFARYGVNGVRFHKFTWDGYEKLNTSTNIEESLFDNHDYFVNVLKEKGIYTR